MLGNTTLMEFLSGGRTAAQHRPWPRYLLDERTWKDMIHQLAESDWSLLSVWTDGSEVHAALWDEEDSFLAVASLSCPDHRFPSLSEVRPGAIRLDPFARTVLAVNEGDRVTIRTLATPPLPNGMAG